ncbi:unnamed protein product [Ectocarpus sp. CCAP 1310/34]|nr:unnamed protein product [Ectocarpus sp. CCAP 1310/34]
MAMMVCSLPECYRPRHQRRGVVHDFCSRTHAQEAADMGLIPPLHRPHGRCHVRPARQKAEGRPGRDAEFSVAQHRRTCMHYILPTST